MTSNSKDKATLCSPTFKFEENKVPLFFGLEVKWMGYGHFEFSRDLSLGISGLNHKMAIYPSYDF